ncbi:MAG: TauD/TfdA family dioxygenase [Pseudomonadota bacterium]
MKIIPHTPGFAADIEGVDARAIDEVTFEALYAAWLHYGVLRLRNQPLDDDELQAFSARFGPLEEIPLGRMPEHQRAQLDNRYVTRISNIVENGRPIGGLGNAEASWHSDMNYVETPPPASVLLGVEIPSVGGDTWFADQAAAHAALPNDLRARAAPLRIKHDAAHTSVGSLRPGFADVSDPRDAPGASHPILQAHAETGLAVLYLGRREWASIPGLTLHDSEALLDDLWQYAALPANTWRQRWRKDDLIIWDNRRVLHRREGFDNRERRLMKRCQVLQRDPPALAAEAPYM